MRNGRMEIADTIDKLIVELVISKISSGRINVISELPILSSKTESK